MIALGAAAAAVALASVRVPVANVWEAPGAGHLPLDPQVWPTSKVSYGERLALVGHMPTQVLYGETVRVLVRRPQWTKVEVPDQPSPLGRHGYPGWVRSWQLGPHRAGPEAVVTVRSTRLRNGTQVGFGSEVPRGSVPAAAVRKLPRTRADIVRTAEQFVGLHYLWGGLSAWGYDCSGLTWAAYRAHGITIPRDADAQYAAGEPVSMAAAKPGDLVFYEGAKPGHVAMLVGGGRMVEAPNSSTVVRIVPVRPGWVGVRRFL
ncbi:MAG TPA: C40 family peptidase [Gaiellaceae bacterium]|nr:C40 family peptidase [Gaiellaceae bacterium]